MTGYHLALNLLLLAFLHWPILFSRWSLIHEARVLSSYLLLAVIWDFLWFVLNPHFGLSRFDAAHVWWFSSWLFGLPRDYYTGLVLSLTLWMTPAFLHRTPARQALAAWIAFTATALTFVFAITLGRRVIA